MILVRYSRAASAERKSVTELIRYVAQEKAGQSARRKFHLEGGRGSGETSERRIGK